MTTVEKIVSISILILTGCAQPESSLKATQQQVENHKATLEIKPKSAFKEIEWTDLMPKADLESLMTPPEYVSAVEEGSLEDIIGNEFPNMEKSASENKYQQALTSTQIKPEMKGQAIRIAGFVVPLEFNDDLAITQFFLVPFFGACIHVPPPPPNQIIFVDYPAGLTQKALDDPFWAYGILNTSLTENEIASAAYSLEMHYFEPYFESYLEE